MMDIADFVEDVCGIKLRDYQKEYIRKLEKNSRAIIFPRTRHFPYWYVYYLVCREEYDKVINEKE